jgi:hypothetical protein
MIDAYPMLDMLDDYDPASRRSSRMHCSLRTDVRHVILEVFFRRENGFPSTISHSRSFSDSFSERPRRRERYSDTLMNVDGCPTSTPSPIADSRLRALILRFPVSVMKFALRRACYRQRFIKEEELILVSSGLDSSILP